MTTLVKTYLQQTSYLIISRDLIQEQFQRPKHHRKTCRDRQTDRQVQAETQTDRQADTDTQTDTQSRTGRERETFKIEAKQTSRHHHQYLSLPIINKLVIKSHSVGLHDEINSIIAIVGLCSLSEQG